MGATSGVGEGEGELNCRPQAVVEVWDVSPSDSPPDFIQFTAPL